MTQKQPHSQIDQRNTVRLLRLLEICKGAHTRANGNICLRHGKQHYSFALSLAAHAIQRGLIIPAGDRLVLQAEGVALLRRALHPDAGYLAQHAKVEMRVAGIGTAPVKVNMHESPLARLRDHKDRDGNPWLADASFVAGEKLRADFERGGLQPKVSSNWGAGVGLTGRTGTSGDISDFALDARARLDAAIGSLEPELAGVSLDICCFLKGFEQVERERRWPPRSAKLMLRTALSILARHYGLSGGGQSRAKMQQWGSADFRPRA